MTASILDGKYVASKWMERVKQQVSARVAQGLSPPGLAVVLVGDHPASTIYVKRKQSACKEVGLLSYFHHLLDTTTEQELLSLIDALNHDDSIHGILVQLPLPNHMNSHNILQSINPEKDVDGFHPSNIGSLAQAKPRLRPCTAYGIIMLLNHYQIPIEGQHAVVVGASNIVGRPVALELLLSKATVTICHSHTKHLQQHVEAADILIVATGKMNVVQTEWLHGKQIVIDVGIHRLNDNTIRGDIDFQVAKEKVAWISPVPGGVGPMTIACLLHNTLLAATLSL